ncbi:uncharacterized protein MKK02DRAFT_40492 [Dioszegia hungarica]|uniref:DUF6534 domain-containing protein n=1 Tax=Dioszegia hungarica TaxID=4972 RepID=A0AA38H3N1_9TREE|nr:uncharacterized protein MKK02DRAFT_40492 [Dioszegia hungarica]KAI9632194.1 hypothetical protein MKK02DRAFT_40492 [Dioszegia hungarica]
MSLPLNLPIINPDLVPAMAHIKGPPMMGFIVTTVLFGCSLLAMVNYLQFSWGTDRKGTRSLVLVTAFLACISMVVVASTLRQFVFRYGQGFSPDDAMWESLNYLVNALTHCVVGGFFARRAWKMYGRPIYLAIGLSSILLISFVAAIGAMAARMARILTLSDLARFSAFNYTLSISQALGDTTITALIVYKLLKLRTGWKQTDSTIHKLVVIGIETQAPPAIMAIAFMATYIAARPEYITFFVCTPMVYVLCLITSLNSRYTMSARQTDKPSTWKDDGALSRRTQTATKIEVTTDVYRHEDTLEINDMERKRTPVRGGGKASESDESLDRDDIKELNTSQIHLV